MDLSNSTALPILRSQKSTSDFLRTLAEITSEAAGRRPKNRTPELAEFTAAALRQMSALLLAYADTLTVVDGSAQGGIIPQPQPLTAEPDAPELVIIPATAESRPGPVVLMDIAPHPHGLGEIVSVAPAAEVFAPELEVRAGHIAEISGSLLMDPFVNPAPAPPDEPVNGDPFHTPWPLPTDYGPQFFSDNGYANQIAPGSAPKA